MSKEIIPIDMSSHLNYEDLADSMDGDTQKAKIKSFDKLKQFFKSLTVYGSIEFPLFLESDIRTKLGLTDRIRRKNISDFTTTFIFIKDPNGKFRKHKAITEFGLYFALGTSNSPEAIIFYKLIYTVFRQLRLKGEAHINKIIKNYESDIKALTNETKRLQIEYKNYKIDTKEELNIEKNKYFNEQMEASHARGKVKELIHDIEINMPLKNSIDRENIVLQDVYQAYMTPIYVYIVNLNDISKENNEGYMNYDLTDYDELIINDIDGEELRYIFIKDQLPRFPKYITAKKIKRLYIVDSNTVFKEFIDMLMSHKYSTPITKSNNTSYHPPVFNIALCKVETILNKINKVSIDKRIKKNEAKRRKLLEERITKERCRLLEKEINKKSKEKK